uniref:Ig-like domain-containing protein n=1 Tax=Zonotrichia albicollis TaxID=44394 RepID=A0A8D2M1Q0_ZONAL
LQPGAVLPPNVSISLVPPSSSQPGPGRLLCSVMDFYPAAIQVRWFQGEQELSEHVGGHRRGPQRGLDLPAAGAAGNHPRRGLSYSCQVEHASPGNTVETSCVSLSHVAPPGDHVPW